MIYIVLYIRLIDADNNNNHRQYKTELFLIFPFLEISLHIIGVHATKILTSIWYIRLCGSPPFFAPNRPQLFERIRSIDYCFHSPGKSRTLELLPFIHNSIAFFKSSFIKHDKN